MKDENRLRIGCSGWSYKDWVGPFYPKELRPGDYLGFYSKVFDSVEIDSSFYRVPNSFVVNQWKTRTPTDFLFCPKLPKKITHDNKLTNFESNLAYFYGVISKLGNKLGPIVIQLPPSIKQDKHMEIMRHFVSQLSSDFSHAIEFRHKSWFNTKTYSLLHDNNIAMVWSMNQYLETPTEVTSDFVYLRLVGDRQISSFSTIQKNRTEDMRRWADSISSKSKEFERGFVFFNNHFAGFGPDSANEFRRLLGMIELDWASQGARQTTLLG